MSEKIIAMYLLRSVAVCEVATSATTFIHSLVVVVVDFIRRAHKQRATHHNNKNFPFHFGVAFA